MEILLKDKNGITLNTANKYCKDDILIKPETEEITIEPSLEQQVREGLFNTVTVKPIENMVDTRDADASTNDMLQGRTAYVNNVKIAGNISEYNGAFEGFEEGTAVVDTADADATAKDIAKDKTAYVNGEKVVGTMVAFDGSQLRQCYNMYYGNTTIIEWGGLDTSNVTHMNYMFYGCNALKKATFSNTSNVKHMAMMFEGCSSLEELVGLDTSNVLAMNRMFYGCSLLKSAIGIDTSKVTSNNNIVMIFYGCKSLVDVPVFDWSSIPNALGKDMFTGCLSLSDESLNNILASCINTPLITNATYKKLSFIGLTQTQATRCQSLSNWEAFSNRGWTTGF